MAAEDRSVRQRIGPSSSSAAAAGSSSAMSASSAATFSSVPDPSFAVTPAPLSLMRLAVVERTVSHARVHAPRRCGL